MAFNIDLNAVKNGLITNYHLAAAKASEWCGRGAIMIKSGREIALPYLQDKRIAAISLIAVNIVLLVLGDVFGRLFAFFLPNQSERQEAFRSVVEIVVSFTTLVGGVAAFAKYGNLPFSKGAIVAISVATFFFSVIMCK